MKKLFGYLFVILLCLGTIYYRKPIATFLYKNFILKKEIEVPEVVSYKKEADYQYIQNTTDFYPKNKKEVLNVLYTILNSGGTEFSFYCDDSYTDCYQDINAIAADKNILGNINNFVHPYNTYDNISISINNFNKVTVTVNHLYTTADILASDIIVDNLYASLVTNDMTDYEKIKKIHDYIINNTAYDQKKERSPVDKTKYLYKSNTAYGPLINGIALCGGYTDAMALFLEKMNIPNYRIASENHIWNLVYINGEWKHLDLTWDDPVLLGSSLLTHKFFLINTNTLKNLDNKEHNYDTDVYLEAN